MAARLVREPESDPCSDLTMFVIWDSGMETSELLAAGVSGRQRAPLLTLGRCFSCCFFPTIIGTNMIFKRSSAQITPLPKVLVVRAGHN